MNKVIVTTGEYEEVKGEDGEYLDIRNVVKEFDDVVAHQIGNGAVQIVFSDGVQKIPATW